jgi:lipopolysaccharide/colanic/teichoic acid biosynthesis glycosyltransferase
MLWDSLTTTDQPALGPDRDAAPGRGEGDAIAAVAAPARDTGEGAATAAIAPSRLLYDRASRCLNCAIAGGVLLLLSPLWLAIAVAIKLTSPGPVFFTRTVVGRNSRGFVYYKFRTMRHRNDDSTHRAFLEQYVTENKPYRVERDPITGVERPVFKVVHDPRITAVGRLLRRWSLDEIPQLLNVLRGEMSLVGPRPPIEFEYQLYDEATKARLAVLPGLTGLAQVRGRGHLAFDEMVALDIEYIQRRSLLLDLQIMAATARVLFQGD